MKNLLKAVFTLSLFSGIVKALGFIFRIFLSLRLGAELMGVYTAALSVYTAACTLTCGGLPLVVSRKTSAFRARGGLAAGHSTVNAALVTGLGLSALVCAVAAVVCIFFPGVFPDRRMVPILLLLLPGVAAGAVHSAFYGALWGRQKYFAVSVVELFEQVLRIAFCILMLNVFLSFDKSLSVSLSLSVSCIGGAALAMIIYFKQGGRLKSPRGFLMPVIRETAPITGMRLTGSLVNTAVSMLLPTMLILQAGMNNSEAMSAFGAAVGMALPLLFLPSTLVGSLAVALVPELSSKIQAGDKEGVKSDVEKAIIFSVLICILSMPLFYSVGDLIGVFIYRNAEVGGYLVTATWIMLPVSMEQITSSMMNSLGLEVKSYRNYCLTAVILFACVLLLPGKFGMNAYFIGAGASAGVQTVLHVWDIKKKIGIRYSFLRPLGLGVIITSLSGLLGWFLHNILSSLPIWANIIVSGGVSVAAAFILSCAFNIVSAPRLARLVFKGKKQARVSVLQCLL